MLFWVGQSQPFFLTCKVELNSLLCAAAAAREPDNLLPGSRSAPNPFAGAPSFPDVHQPLSSARSDTAVVLGRAGEHVLQSPYATPIPGPPLSGPRDLPRSAWGMHVGCSLQCLGCSLHTGWQKGDRLGCHALQDALFFQSRGLLCPAMHLCSIPSKPQRSPHVPSHPQLNLPPALTSSTSTPFQTWRPHSSWRQLPPHLPASIPAQMHHLLKLPNSSRPAIQWRPCLRTCQPTCFPHCMHSPTCSSHLCIKGPRIASCLHRGEGRLAALVQCREVVMKVHCLSPCSCHPGVVEDCLCF